MYIEVTKLQEVRSVQVGASGSSGAHRLWRVAGLRWRPRWRSSTRLHAAPR